LEYVSELLQKIIREGDKVYRYGGEEFAILAKGNEEDVRFLLERILESFQGLVQIESLKDTESGEKELIDLKLQLSMGSVSSEQIEEEAWSLDNFILDADRALYYVKEHGRNGIFQVGVDTEEESEKKNKPVLTLDRLFQKIRVFFNR